MLLLQVTLMPEYLVVCCWRSIKEVSLLLGQLTEATAIYQSDTSITTVATASSCALLSMQQVHKTRREQMKI